MEGSIKKYSLYAFLLIELVLYAFIMLSNGDLLVATSYASIIICFIYSLVFIKESNVFILSGLLFTCFADFCLVICDPQQQLWGMVFFLFAQSIYAIMIHRRNNSKVLLLSRITLTVVGIIIACFVLKTNTDALALVSICYYANLILNIVASFFGQQRSKIFSIGLILFLLCDTVIGLQVVAESYLSISDSSVIHKIIFMDFNLAWFFYLPSQVLIAISGKFNK